MSPELQKRIAALMDQAYEEGYQPVMVLGSRPEGYDLAVTVVNYLGEFGETLLKEGYRAEKIERRKNKPKIIRVN